MESTEKMYLVIPGDAIESNIEHAIPDPIDHFMDAKSKASSLAKKVNKRYYIFESIGGYDPPPKPIPTYFETKEERKEDEDELGDPPF